VAIVVVPVDDLFMMVEVTENVPGFKPLPGLGLWPSTAAASQVASRLNELLGLTDKDAHRLVLSSMAAEGAARAAKRAMGRKET
jgi:hypothetical protein